MENINKTTRGKPSETELAYIAGIIDGEGYLGMSKNRTKKQRQKSPKYQTEICVVNTNYALIEWLQIRIGGLINTRKKYDEAWKVAYRWRIQESNHSEFLQAIYPYLVIKRQQAQLIIEYWIKKVKQYREGRRWEMSNDELNMRESYFQKLKDLNAKGNKERPQRLNESTPQGDATVRTA